MLISGYFFNGSPETLLHTEGDNAAVEEVTIING